MSHAVEPAPSGRFFRPLACLTAAYTLVLVFATHYPRPEELLGPNAPSDKTLHFIAYGLLGSSAAATLATSGRWSPRTVTITLAALAGFAVIDEVTQPLFKRQAEPLDWVCDVIGLAAGIAVVAAARGWQRRLRPNRASGSGRDPQ
jgi:VanZ family protein